MKIAHLSDVHFGTHIPDVVEGLLTRLHDLHPDLVIASGDFTSAGRRGEFRSAARFLEHIGAPVVACPGNHDVPVYNPIDRFFKPFARYDAHIAPRTRRTFRSRAAAILAVNSATPWDLSLNWSHGHLTDQQAQQADEFFAASTESRLRALVVHHPFYVPEDLPGFRTIRNGERMLETLANRDVQLVFSGHLHRQFQVTHTVRLDAGPREIVLLQVGTATSSRRRNQPNAFALLNVDHAGVELAEQVWDDQRFVGREPHSVLRFRDTSDADTPPRDASDRARGEHPGTPTAQARRRDAS